MPDDTDQHWSVVKVLRTGGGSRPRVEQVQLEDQLAVLKDYSGCDPLFALILGRTLARRECDALTRLVSVDGVPGLIERRGSRALLMEWMPAVPFKYVQRDLQFWESFFSELEQRLASMHECGVAHCDLRGMNNVLLDEEGQPCIVDFVACFFDGPDWNLLWRAVFRRFCRADRKALIKLKYQVAPELLSEKEKMNLGHSSRVDRCARQVGILLRRLSRLLLTR